MAERDSVGGRMKQARLQAAVQLGEHVSQERMAELVSAELGRVLHPTQWRRYETDREPPLDVISAAARVSGLSEAYIAFGAGDVEVPDPRLDRRLTPLEEQRALRAADSERSAKAAQGRSKRKRSGGSK